MFTVKIKLKESPIHGIGLFADEDIPKGKIIYLANPKLNLLLTQEEFSKLSSNEKETIQHYGYYDKIKKKWHLSFDDIRFCNHSFESNLTKQNDKVITKRDIKKGDELTHNYKEFEDPLRNGLINK